MKAWTGGGKGPGRRIAACCAILLVAAAALCGVAGCAAALKYFSARELSGEVAAGQRFVVTVPSNVDAVYAWRYVAADSVALRETWYEPGEPGQGLWFFDFHGTRAGEYRLHFICSKASDPAAVPVAHHYFYLTVK